MAGIENWGTSLILWLQSFSGPVPDLLFGLITFLGDEKFYLFLLPLIYWCIDKRLGIRLAVLVMASDAINLALKYAFGLPRPQPPVRVMGTETGPGFPSGHTQAVTVGFGYLARQGRTRASYLAAAALIVLVGLSRMYLGLHFPHDVLGGLFFGLVVLFLFARLEPAAGRRWLALPSAARYALAFGIPVAVLLVWPHEDAAGSLGALAGFGVGAFIEVQAIGFAAEGSPRQRLLRFVLGFVGVAVLYFGLKLVLPEGVGWRFLRYGAVGLYASAAAPWLFVRLRLARAEVTLALARAEGKGV